MENEESLKKKIKIALASGLTALSIASADKIDNVQQIINPEIEEEEIDENEQLEDKKQAKKSVNDVLYQIPLVIRVLICLPLYIIGNILVFLLQKFYATVVISVLKVLLFVGLFILIMLLILALICKLICPSAKLKELFSIKNILILAFGGVFIKWMDLYGKLFVSNYEHIKAVLYIVIILICSLFIVIPFVIRAKKEYCVRELIIEYNDQKISL